MQTTHQEAFFLRFLTHAFYYGDVSKMNRWLQYVLYIVKIPNLGTNWKYTFHIQISENNLGHWTKIILFVDGE
jgi:hypothetical protein